MNPIRSTCARSSIRNCLRKPWPSASFSALMGTTCLIQLANIQLINGKTMAQAAAQSRTTTVTLKARRGKIMDTNGSILAQSVERYTIIGNPDNRRRRSAPTTCTNKTGRQLPSDQWQAGRCYGSCSRSSTAGPRTGHGRHRTGCHTVEQRANMRYSKKM